MIDWVKIPTHLLITEADELFSELDKDTLGEDRIAIFRELLSRIRSLNKKIDEWKTNVELPIVMRTHFTGDDPYVGTKGLGLAVEETVDDLLHHKSMLMNIIATFEITAYYINSPEITHSENDRKAVAESINYLVDSLKEFAASPRKKPFQKDLRSKLKVINNENPPVAIPKVDDREE